MSKVANKRNIKQLGNDDSKLKKLEKKSTRANSAGTANDNEAVDPKKIKRLFEKDEKAR